MTTESTETTTTEEQSAPRRLDQIPKAYDPQAVEQRLYHWWESEGYFRPRPSRNPDRRPFVISMPPPNVTGALHLGHAITAALEDVMIRYHRMIGDETLWVPGEDHAGISTQNVVEKQLAKEGKTRQQIGREAFVERVWEWVHQYKSNIQNQHRRLGVSCDWERERFTLDDGLARAVREVFVRLYEEGLIYRAERIINWCPRCMSAISDLEVEVENTPGKLTYVRYPLEPAEGQASKGEPGYIMVATTRPETILGDTAIAVNPDDARYKDLIGRTVIVPIMNRRIPIVADAAVEKDFGTGAVKVTPAHDPTDFEIGQRHALPSIQVIGFDARMTEAAGAFAGQDRYDARKGVVAELERLGLLDHEEDYTIPLGHCERCGTVIEPLISMQWWVKIAPLATPALNAVRYGQTQIIPARFTKTYTDWMENIHDWNISRQLWWGHRIPAWYCQKCGEIVVAREDPASCPRCGSERLEQDPDVLDTWFSSWLWPFSTLGWPDDTPDLRRYYPTSVLETGYDIIFFWVARMMMSGTHFMGMAPFHTIYLHGMVRDKLGRKMSKSLGNGIDPIEVIDQYGSDALRFTLLTTSTPGNDTKLDVTRIAGNRNFANKIWNAARFVIGQTEGAGGGIPAPEALQPKTLADRWILSRLARLTSETTRLMEDYQFGEAGRQLFEFFWSEYCDWYLEVAKRQLQDAKLRESTAQILRSALDTALRLLHPFMPFLTEEVWGHLWAEEPADQRPASALIIASWPSLDAEAQARLSDATAEEEFALLQEITTRIRDARKQINDVRQEQKQPKLPRVRVILAGGKRTTLLKQQAALIEQLAATEPPQIERKLATKPEKAMSMVASGVEIYIPVADLFDIEREIARIDEQIKVAQAAIARTQGMLANENFVTRARPDVVQKERDALAAGEDTLARLEAQRRELAG
ncbi:MAG TPA: valine--tRNA ligase [Ktedonobacterales bacterium]|nr:valine--tRNA ligase [Ktedonobacterales bacterium]